MITFSPFAGLQVCYSERTDGSFRELEKIKEKLSNFCTQNISLLSLEHGIHIHQVKMLSSDIREGDSILTNIPLQTIGLVVGDCFPVVLYDPDKKVVALVHAGWKSLAQDILALTIEQMHTLYQTEEHRLCTWIGPGICKDHYLQQHTPEQRSDVRWKTMITKTKHGEYSVDLQQFIVDELNRLGVQSNQITEENRCTYQEKTRFFSHRRSTLEGDEDGRFFVGAWII